MEWCLVDVIRIRLIIPKINTLLISQGKLCDKLVRRFHIIVFKD